MQLSVRALLGVDGAAFLIRLHFFLRFELNPSLFHNAVYSFPKARKRLYRKASSPRYLRGKLRHRHPPALKSHLRFGPVVAL